MIQRRWIAGAVAVLLAGAGAAAVVVRKAASGPDTPAQAADRLQRTAKTLAAQPVVHWKGTQEGKAGPRKLELTMIGAEQGFGTVATGSDQADVLILDAGHMLVKGSAGYWKQSLAGKAEIAKWSDHWVLVADEPLFGTLAKLAPKTLATTLSDPKLTVRPGDSKQARPAGVPKDAKPIGIEGQHNDVARLWVTDDQTPRVAAFQGDTLPGYRSGFHGAMVLTADPGPAQAAQTWATSLRSVPKFVAVRGFLKKELKITKLRSHCPDSLKCTITMWAINPPGNGSMVVSGVGAMVLYAHADDDLDAIVGNCTLTLPPARPRATVKGTCTVSDPRIDRTWAKTKRIMSYHSDWQDTTSLGFARFTPSTWTKTPT